MAAEATLEHRCRLELGQMAAIQEQTVGVVRDLASGRQSRDRNALQGDKAKRVLGAVGKESVPVPNGDETHGTMSLLQGRDLAEHLEFARAFADGIARRPRRGPHNRDSISNCLGKGGRIQECGGQSACHPRQN